MINLEKINEYFQTFTNESEEDLDVNLTYATSLAKAFRDEKSLDLEMFDPENHSSAEGKCIPFALIPKDGRSDVTNYSDLIAKPHILSDFELVLCKMHAGLGSSVKRKDHLKMMSGREKLGSKGTDLFFEVNGDSISIAELQFHQVRRLKDTNIYREVSILNVVNEETIDEVEKIERAFDESVNILPHIKQFKIPTVDERLELTTQRLAPAGHGLVGYSLLLKIFESEVSKKIISIGNGEDLNSTPDDKITSWMVEREIPVVMITTTKLECDKKGGQISKEEKDDKFFYTIVEKAQAEKAHQLDYFQKLGLREGDFEALFNTNIVVINTEALKKEMIQASELDTEKFREIITPFVIKNTKMQNGGAFTQLEGALGSVMLNLDKYFRLNHGRGMLHFLNLSADERSEFFMPIKKFEDFSEITKTHKYSDKTGRLERI